MTRDQHVLKLWRRINKITIAVVQDQPRWTELWKRWNAVILRKFGPPTKEYSRNGYRPRVGHRHRGKHANHYDAQPGQVHACDRFGSGFASLCGLVIDENAENQWGDPIKTVFPPEPYRVTCNRCRKLIGLPGLPAVKHPKKRPETFGS